MKHRPTVTRFFNYNFSVFISWSNIKKGETKPNNHRFMSSILLETFFRAKCLQKKKWRIVPPPTTTTTTLVRNGATQRRNAPKSRKLDVIIETALVSKTKTTKGDHKKATKTSCNPSHIVELQKFFSLFFRCCCCAFHLEFLLGNFPSLLAVKCPTLSLTNIEMTMR